MLIRSLILSVVVVVTLAGCEPPRETLNDRLFRMQMEDQAENSRKEDERKKLPIPYIGMKESDLNKTRVKGCVDLIRSKTTINEQINVYYSSCIGFISKLYFRDGVLYQVVQ